MPRTLHRPALLAAIAVLTVSGCTGGKDAAPELGLPEPPTRSSVTALDGGLTEQFTLTLEDLTGISPEGCDEQGRCAILTDPESPDGTLLVHAWHDEPARDRYLGLDSTTGDVVWSLPESEGAVGSTYVSRHGPLLLGLTQDKSGEGRSGSTRGLLLEPSTGEIISEVQNPEGTRVLSAIDTHYGIAILAVVMADGADTIEELVGLGLGADGTEHWRTSIEPGADADAYYSIVAGEAGIRVESSTIDGSVVHALLAPDTGDELDVPADAADGSSTFSVDLDDGSVEGFTVAQDPKTFETTIGTADGETWTLPRTDTGALNSLRGVCGGLVITAEISPSGMDTDLSVRAYDPLTGEERWAAPIQAQHTALCADGSVLVNDRTRAYLLDPGTGEFLETYELAPGATPVPEDGQEYDVPRSLSLRSVSAFTADASIVAEVHEEGELPQLTVYR